MSETLTFARQYKTKSKAMKIYFAVFVVLFAILSLVHDSQGFSAAAGTTSGRRNLEKVMCLIFMQRSKSNQENTFGKHFFLSKLYAHIN